MVKIFFVIIASENEPWESIFNDGQLQTWLTDLGQSEQYIAAYSDNSLGFTQQNPDDHRRIEFSDESKQVWNLSAPKFLSNNRARFVSYEGFGGIIPTSMSAIKFGLDRYSPDFIIRTNVSSYWNLDVLREVLVSLPKTDFYGGVPGPIPRSMTKTLQSQLYASGAGIFMSADVAHLITSNSSNLDLSIIDDLAIARFMHSQRIRVRKMSRYDLNFAEEVSDLDDRTLLSSYHYRCKAGTDSRIDVSIMKTLHKRLKQ